MQLFQREPNAIASIPFRTYNPNRHKSANALTASGFRINRQNSDAMRRLVQPWQTRAFAYYDIVPEIKYAAQFYSRALSLLRLYPATKDDQGELEETTDPDAVEQLARIQDPGGGRSTLLSVYGRLMFLTGEGYLFVSRDPDTDMEQWEMLSTDELKIVGSEYLRFKAPSMLAEDYHDPVDSDYEPVDDDEAVAYRIWKRHPRYSFLADSTMQGVLDVCEELVLLTQVIRARARSRMAGSGILLVNGKVTPVPLEPVPDEDPEEDEFMRELVESMTSPIVDEGSASAVVPLVLRVEAEHLDEVMKHIQIVDPTQLYPETGLRHELIERLAIGLDMPAEMLTGMSDANHWTAWQVDEQTWKGHLAPVAQQLVDDLTSAFYQPQMRELGKSNWQELCIGYDAAAVINHPDRSKDANELYDRQAIGKQALRDAKGFVDSDAPTEEELWEMIGIKLRDGSYVKYGIPMVRGTGIEPEAGELEGQQGIQQVPVSNGNGNGNGPPPAAEQQGGSPLPANVLGSARERQVFVARVLGASDLALYRARELAGNRLRSYAKRDQVMLALLDGVRARDVAYALGRDRALKLAAPAERTLVSGAREFLTDALRMWGLPDELLEPLGDRIEQHAARTLYDERPAGLPPSFENYVTGLYEAAA